MASLSNRVISIYNRKTSMRLAPAEWEAIDTICRRENIKRKKLFELIDANKDEKIKELEQECNSLKEMLNKIPKFIKIISKPNDFRCQPFQPYIRSDKGNSLAFSRQQYHLHFNIRYTDIFITKSFALPVWQD